MQDEDTPMQDAVTPTSSPPPPTTSSSSSSSASSSAKPPSPDTIDLIPVHVEVCLRPDSAAPPSLIEPYVRKYLQTTTPFFTSGRLALPADDFATHIHSIYVDCPPVAAAAASSAAASSSSPAGIPFFQVDLVLHVFRLNQEGAMAEYADGSGGDGDDQVVALEQWMLPAGDFEGLWESLYLAAGVKERLLGFAATSLLFSEAQVDPSIISANRVVLLHGPPGTGKTTMCKALAQKLSMRLACPTSDSSSSSPSPGLTARYSSGAVLLEINAHSLFSKWFSESGKLVSRLFETIGEMVSDPELLVFVLIDEVESLTAARSAAMSGTEPSDAIRVVNALLTQIDKLKPCSNVMILTTSNITEAIDLAFVDRADIKQFVGLPGLRARYEILKSCVAELARVGIVQPAPGPDELVGFSRLARVAMYAPGAAREDAGDEVLSPAVDGELARAHPLSHALLKVAARCRGLSGRMLRKLPFQAHAFFAQRGRLSPQQFVDMLARAAETELDGRSRLTLAGSAPASDSVQVQQERAELLGA